jgi:hypothetical protein
MTSGEYIMTPGSVKTVAYKGVTCKSDMCLYLQGEYTNTVFILSLYGAPQQVKAIFSALSLGKEIVQKNNILTRDYKSSIRFKGRSLGRGKYHGMIFTDDIKDHVVWTEPDKRIKALQTALSRRKIPFDREWLTDIEALLLRDEYLTKMQGWGGISGYEALWDDDAICNLICGEIINGSLAV